jgi:hypothetical protein
MNDATPAVRGRARRERPQDIVTRTYHIDGDLYQVQQGVVSFVIRRQSMMTVPGKGQVPYWHTVVNRDEVVKVLKAI